MGLKDELFKSDLVTPDQIRPDQGAVFRLEVAISRIVIARHGYGIKHISLQIRLDSASLLSFWLNLSSAAYSMARGNGIVVYYFCGKR
ncbi:hypothetical protein DYU11_08575 [Fibrisoma montanum]|uniref:Uncharacterized protein n=1 Tax=Fibrisoma montanum TaxID=2305895 RepID=A0A418MEX1_9BACT|nr:hypothetical protein DYU11_08575 [Fibrisoma montanum]